MIGVVFADENEARMFHKKVNRRKVEKCKSRHSYQYQFS